MEKIHPDFYKGMDISFLPQCMDEGMLVRDFDGAVTEPFGLLQKYGVNAIRLRLWHTPENVPETKGYCNLAHTMEMAGRAKAHGMEFMLDFHYSDYWADPAQQRKPKAWEKLDFAGLEQAVYEYTLDTLLALKREGLLPGVVQIGNEIRSGLLFPDGELPDYAHMVRLVNAGIRGARAAAGQDEMRVMIHLDQGGRYFYLKEWFTKAFENGLLDFDLIGLSYYPFWHGTFNDLKETMERLIADYHKPIMIVETAHAWRKIKGGFIDEAQEKIAGFPATPEGQKTVLELVENIVASLPDHMGQGIFYWEPLCVPKGAGGWAANMGLLREDGQVMEGILAFGFNEKNAGCREIAKIYEPQVCVTAPGEIPVFPKEISALLWDGSIRKRKVSWKRESSFEVPGEYRIEGIVEGAEQPVWMTVRVMSRSEERKNLLYDSNWDEGLTRWETACSGPEVIAQIFPEFADPYPAPPLNALRVEGSKNFTFRISQRVRITRPGRYAFVAELQGTDTTNVDVRMFIQTASERRENVIHLTEHGWELQRMEAMVCESGFVSAGITIQASPMHGMVRRLSLVRVDDI